MTLDERIRKARLDAGFTSAKAAAKAVGVPYPTYAGHENGSRGVKRGEIERYAATFAVTESWLLFGSLPHQRAVPLLGVFGDMTLQISSGEQSLFLDIPFDCPPDVKAIRCLDDSLAPAYLKNDVILVADKPVKSGAAFRALADLVGHGIVVGRLLEFVDARHCHFQLATGQVLLAIEFRSIKKIIGMVCQSDQADAAQVSGPLDNVSLLHDEKRTARRRSASGRL